MPHDNGILNKQESKMNWMNAIVESLKDKLVFAKDLLGSEEAAIERVKNETCAGPKAWEIALSELGWA